MADPRRTGTFESDKTRVRGVADHRSNSNEGTCKPDYSTDNQRNGGAMFNNESTFYNYKDGPPGGDPRPPLLTHSGSGNVNIQLPPGTNAGMPNSTRGMENQHFPSRSVNHVPHPPPSFVRDPFESPNHGQAFESPSQQSTFHEPKHEQHNSQHTIMPQPPRFDPQQFLQHMPRPPQPMYQPDAGTFNYPGPHERRHDPLPSGMSGPAPFPDVAWTGTNFHPHQLSQAQWAPLLQQQRRHPGQRQIQSQKEIDQEWTFNWLLSGDVISRQKTSKMKPKLTIGEFKQLLKEIILLNSQLTEQRDNLARCIEKDESFWQFECRKTDKIKDKLMKAQEQLYDAEQVSLMKQKIEKQRKKRDSSKRRNARRQAEKEESLKRREELHRKMDEKIAKEENKKLEKKREEQLQKEVDKIFFEVRQKKAEADKALNVLKLLRKLRHLRKESAERKGVPTSGSSSQAFEETIERLEKLMQRQRDVYTDEEKTMQVMMHFEQEENKEKEREAQRRRLQDRAKKVVKEQLLCLFEDEGPLTPEDPLYPFRQYYLQAENNPQALLEVRHQWDSFLAAEGTPGSSTIPIEWVTPGMPTNETWASYVEKT